YMRSYSELLEASGYGSRPGRAREQDFDDLIRILDSEIRLITPTDPEGATGDERPEVGDQKSEVGEQRSEISRPLTSALRPLTSDLTTRFYQLTHDYLVPSLRDWLTRKPQETRRGRAELLLADRAVVWNARPENRQLPSLWHWLRIRWLTPKKNWTPPQRKLMRKATRSHAL